MMVVDTKGQHFVNREKTDKGKFAFTTDNYDVFEICFISRVPANMRGGRWDQSYDVTFIPIKQTQPITLLSQGMKFSWQPSMV